MVTCGICHDEHLTEIGALDSCDHSFCFACIQHWAQIESRCPFCKSRFITISRKALDLEKLPDSEAESDDTVRQRFPGTVLETVAIPERNQVYLGDAEWAGDGEGEGQDPLGNVVCMECGRGDDEDNLMLCDGCERACHTYCANLDALPEGDWFCWVCQENRDRELAGEEVVDLTAARRPQRSTRTTLVASDFTLPRSRRRASSPGARSELARPRRVRRRLVRSGEGLQARRPGGSSQRHGSDADSILNALERSISARDNAGLSTSTEHRRLAGLRGAWNSVRQGHRPFPVAAHPPPPQIPATAPQAGGPESEAWAAFEASRRAQDRAARHASVTTAVPASNFQPVVPGSPPAHRHSGQQSASSLARQAVAEARSRGRRLGPTGRQLASPNPRASLPVHRLSSSAQNPRVRASHQSSPVAPTVASERRRASADPDPPRSPRLGHGPPMSGAGRRAMGSERQLSPSGSGRAESAAGGRAVHEPGRRFLQQHFSSSMYRSLPRGASHIYRQTDAVQGPAHGPQLRSTDHATDNSNCAVAAADADSYKPNPNLMLVQQSFYDRPDDSVQPPESWSAHPSPQHPWTQHQPWSQQASWNQQHQPAQTAASLHALPTPCSPVHPPKQHQANADASRQHPSWHDLRAPPVPAQLGQAPSKDHAMGQVAQHAVGQVAQHAVGQAAQHAGPDRGEDSSDSSTSQLASRQRAVQGLQATDISDATLGPRSRRHASTKALQTNHANAAQHDEAASSGAASELHLRLTKQEAADAVKTLIKPLYVAKQLSKEQFKVIAQSCTHILTNNKRAAQQDACRVVLDCMNDMGLSEQAALL